VVIIEDPKNNAEYNICHVKGVNKLFLQSKYEISIIVSNDKVINIYNNNQSVSIGMEYIQVVINSQCLKPIRRKKLPILAYQAWGACFKPQSDFSSRQTRLEYHKTRWLFHEKILR
jgi:hypothetical protein